MINLERMISTVNDDTIKLLRECDAGVKMGVDSIDDVLGFVKNNEFKNILDECKNDHNALNGEIQKQLCKYNDDGKDPNIVSKGMSWMKTNVKLVMNESDNTIADLMTDGCNMGVKSLNRYLNQYKAANDMSKNIAKRLINLEQRLCTDIQCYL